MIVNTTCHDSLAEALTNGSCPMLVHYIPRLNFYHVFCCTNWILMRLSATTYYPLPASKQCAKICDQTLSTPYCGFSTSWWIKGTLNRPSPFPFLYPGIEVRSDNGRVKAGGSITRRLKHRINKVALARAILLRKFELCCYADCWSIS